MWYVYLFLSLLSFSCFGQDSWLCTEDSSQIQGDQILACGVGEGETESAARKSALQSAQDEFLVVCGPNTNCGEHKFKASPSRSTCSKKDGAWKCYRLVKYAIESDRKIASNVKAYPVYDMRVRDETMDAIDRWVDKSIKEMGGL